tara:strand:+ start:1327 stop:1929 length:603 start_codon:yes stop_codon:yes gene_type:complete
MKKKVFEYFPHPVFKYKVDNYSNHNKTLMNYIHHLKKEDPIGQKRSNVGGWHSPFFDLKNTKSEGYKFLEIIQPYIFDVFKSYGWKYEPKKIFYSGMWAIINKKENSNNEHIHPNSNLSAAYYVKAPENCGEFAVSNPHAISRNIYPERENPTEFNRIIAKHKVEEGDLLIFPAYLPHQVLPNKSDEDRIVISFNLWIQR